ncbi:MAG: DsrE family protein [Ferruginibacter sp.]
MKKLSLIFAFLTMLALNVCAQQTDYKVVFDMSTRDSLSQLAVIREVQLIKDNNPAAKIEVVVYGQGINLVLKEKTKQAETISKLAADPNITFKVCAFTMQRFQVDETKLVPGVTVVPDGIYEIISKERAGWGYIKVAH